MKLTKSKIWIEEKTFEDREEFRIVIEEEYPSGLDRKGSFQRYLSTLFDGSGGMVDYVFIAYKQNNWLKRFFGYDYRNQTRIAIQKCDALINQYKKDIEKSKIIQYKR